MTSYPLKNGCTDNWTWRKDHTARPIIYCVNRMPVHVKNETRALHCYTLRGTKVLDSNAHYWEVQHGRIDDDLYIGVVRGKHLNPDMKLESLNLIERRRGRSFRDHKQTVIGVLFNRKQGTLSYYQDGVQLGVAMTVPNHLDYELFPAVWNLALVTEVKLGRRLRSFYNYENLQNRCRATIMELILEKADIDLLNLPTVMKDYLRDGYYEH